ncbi:S-adenosyl-L-methionine-dependent methyltransferase [Tribonema minus]|uniref:S-adenosyl-L-methionine-dependent methyltransferase n=1 Tax=Tribonema minus TaxID=303371 RepID=A0A836CJW7_9STRA|nr:S-adenosyl-L-methionine-dependent methyltransferase [Tribonema minus]
MSFQYREAARVLSTVQKKRTSLKTLVFAGSSDDAGAAARRKTFALVSETLRHLPLLQALAADCGGLVNAEDVHDSDQAWVMLYDLLFGKGSIQGGGALKRHLVARDAQLRAALAALKAARGLPPDAAAELLLPDAARRHAFPRYARVNLLRAAPDAVEAQLRAEGLEVARDGTVGALLVLPHGTDLHAHALVADGRLILQDKSSCFSAQALLGGGSSWLDGGDVIDACAAPGNKTLHAAALLSAAALSGAAAAAAAAASHHVFAFDRDAKRLALLRRRCDGAGGAGRITPCLQDFLAVDVNDARFSRVRGILLDPSCSGSGIVTAPDRWQEEEQGGAGGGDRVDKLAAFQLAALLKALSFPHARRVVYSTCSVHARENEGVVAAALRQQQQQQQRGQGGQGEGEEERCCPGPWRLVKCLPRWHRRGIVPEGSGLTAQQADCMVRAAPADDTNGFFVALFARGPADEGEGKGEGEGEGEGGGVSQKRLLEGGAEGLDDSKRAKKRLKSARKKKNQRLRRQTTLANAAPEGSDGDDGDDDDQDE